MNRGSVGSTGPTYFQHHVSVEGNEGELVVSDTGITVAYSSEKLGKLQYTWANISDVKYSTANDPKGRALMLLKTIAAGKEKCVVRLIGSTVDERFKELERLKTMVSQIRKKSPAGLSSHSPSLSTGTVPGSISGKKRSHSSSQLSNREEQRRKQLLEADKRLAKQYKELVQDQNLITEEDFWANQAEVSVRQGVDPSNTVGNEHRFARGKANSLISDIFEVGADGEIHINLTLEKKQNIFLMNPTVRRAFEAEVPLRRTEASFWEAYFRSEFYSSQQHGQDGGSVGGEGRYGEGLLARYGEELGHKQEAVGPETINKAASGDLHVKLTGKVDLSVDLTAVYGDYHYRERVEDSMDETAGSTSSVISKYNKNSLIVMGSDPSAKKVAAPSALMESSSSRNNREEGRTRIAQRDLAHSLDLTELAKHAEPRYIPMVLQTAGTKAVGGDADPTDTFTTNASHLGGSPPPSGSAFGVAGRPPRRRSDSGDAVTSLTAADFLKTALELPPAGVLVSDLASCLPSAQRGAAAFRADIAKLRQASRNSEERPSGKSTVSSTNSTAQQQQQQQQPPQTKSTLWSPTPTIGGVEGGDLASFLWLDGARASGAGSSADPTSLLDTQFTQTAKESFVEVTELLMHYYAMLNRSGAVAPSSSTSRSAPAQRAEAILQRLTENAGKKLEGRKAALVAAHREKLQMLQQQQPQPHPANESLLVENEKLEAKISVLNGMLLLIQRARVTWSLFTS